ncbi:MAG: uracil-DNA glycosylase [Chitinophagia bacterium]|jgi:uracil-DNA glycosylase|nr:uracil-DNA glycosylase [Chitinophagia bacterium]NCA30058.1 uracil-DNA glycosylase [Chitinophagia bacterium]NDD15678.1 uracil-DNA glycosylase [Chitinophagia bacterium]
MEVKMESSWKNALSDLFDKPYFSQITTHLKAEKALKTTIYPSGGLIFNAFTLTPYNKVKVIILGQDPYHNPHQAMGLSFSVPDGIKPPPSLMNIFKELHKDIGMAIPSSGNLSAWAKQGVLLLNAVLTVRANEPASHAKIGWTKFTDDIIVKLSNEKKGLVFILWGNFAQEKFKLIDSSKHKILKAAHPSPFSAYNGFFGCKHFSATNEYLVKNNTDPIDWAI